jgi:hypothetical protein
MVCLVNDQSIYSNNPFTDKLRFAMSFIMFYDIFAQITILGPIRYASLKWSLVNTSIAAFMIGWTVYIFAHTFNRPDSDHLQTAHICTR